MSATRRFWNRWGWRLLLAQWAVLLASFSGFRFAFFLIYRSNFQSSGWGEVLAGFIHGFRFDLAVIFAFTGFPSLIFLLLSPFRIRVWVGWLLFVFSSAAAAWMFLLEGVDLFYYAFVKRRLSFEVFAMFNDLRPVLALMRDAYLLQAGLVALVLLGILLGAAMWFRRLTARPWQPVHWWSQALQCVLVFLMTALMVRGGLQAKPLSEGMAFRTSNMAIGHLTLNPVYTTMRGLFRSPQRRLSFYPEDEAVAVVRGLLGLHGAPPEPGYPLLRRVEHPSPPGRPKNLVIIVLESFSAQFTGVLGGKGGATPEFDRLAGEGMLFSEFYAAGTRSLEGVASILTGFPALPTGTLIGTSFQQNALSSLPLLLGRAGYSSFFLHGAFQGSMWFDSFASRVGFQRYIAKEDFPQAEKISDGAWGIFDHYSLERLHREIEASPKPVLAFYFSLGPHTPFELPGERFRRFPPGAPDSALRNALAYTDYALGRFFSLARRSDYWRDTVFFITADHNMGGAELNHRERMWIPLLILIPGDPAFPRGRVNSTLGGQADLAPTALQLLGLSAEHAFAGNSLLAPVPGRFALLGWGGQAGWIGRGVLITHDTEKPVAVYRLQSGPEAPKGLSPPSPVNPGLPAAREFQATLQVLNNLLVGNRLYPASR